jgi:hypothetical protein
MTETREISREEYRKITAKASRLLTRISGLMDSVVPDVPSPRLPAEWHELHDLMSLAGVIAATAARYAEQAPDPDAPVPYTMTDGMRDLDAAVKDANPAHAIYADTLDVEPL